MHLRDRLLVQWMALGRVVVFVASIRLKRSGNASNELHGICCWKSRLRCWQVSTFAKVPWRNSTPSLQKGMPATTTNNCSSFACSVLLLLLLVLRLDFVLLFLLSFVCQGVRCPFQTEPLTASHLLEINMLMPGENNFHLFSILRFSCQTAQPNVETLLLSQALLQKPAHELWLRSGATTSEACQCQPRT